MGRSGFFCFVMEHIRQHHCSLYVYAFIYHLSKIRLTKVALFAWYQLTMVVFMAGDKKVN
jgi:hypothetical protein